jgi:hypothetical protein
VIRVSLFLAYLMLFINSTIGSPLWPDVENKGYLALDNLFWSLLGMYIHGSSLVCLLLDERKVELPQNKAALWRMFYRTGGLSSRLFKLIVADRCNVVQYQPGDVIPTDNFFYICYEGRVNLKVIDNNVVKNGQTQVVYVDRWVRSGEMFDLKFLGMFNEGSFFSKHKIHCVAAIPTTLFQFSKNDMSKISHHQYAKGIW